MRACLFCGASSCRGQCVTSTHTWTLEYAQRPWTTNGERASNRWSRAERTREWRHAFCKLAQTSRIPALESAVIIAEPFQVGGRLQDVGACHPSVKAAVDGLVDARILPDDSPEYVKSLHFVTPKRGKNALILHISGKPRRKK